MIPIPRRNTPDGQRMEKIHKECIDSMKGVAGCSILKCATPGDTTVVTGGIHEDFQRSGPRIDANHVALADFRDRTTIEGFGRDVDRGWHLA